MFETSTSCHRTDRAVGKGAVSKGAGFKSGIRFGYCVGGLFGVCGGYHVVVDDCTGSDCPTGFCVDGGCCTGPERCTTGSCHALGNVS